MSLPGRVSSPPPLKFTCSALFGVFHFVLAAAGWAKLLAGVRTARPLFDPFGSDRMFSGAESEGSARYLVDALRVSVAPAALLTAHRLVETRFSNAHLGTSLLTTATQQCQFALSLSLSLSFSVASPTASCAVPLTVAPPGSACAPSDAPKAREPFLDI